MSGHWPIVPIGDVFSIARGGSPRPIDAYLTDDPNGINWILISDASEGNKYICTTKKRIRPEGAKASRLVQPGDFILTNSMSFGRPYILKTSGCIHDGWLVLSPRNGSISADFFYHLLSSNLLYSEFARLAAGATVKNLTIELVKRVDVPIPPLEEQRRIAAILDKGDELRGKRRATLVELGIASESVFYDFFPYHRQTPITIGKELESHPHGWGWKLLKDVARLATGHTPDRQRGDFWNGDTPWITLSQIRQFDGKVAFQTAEGITREGLDHSSAVKLPAGTVCFSRTASVGFVTMMGREMATSQDFVNWVCGPELEPMYLMHAFLRSRERLRALSTGSTHKTIYFSTVEQFKVLVPPIERQREFARRIEALDRLKHCFELSLSEMDSLFASLQHRAFRGEL